MDITNQAVDEVISVGTKTAEFVIRLAGRGARSLASMLYYTFQNRDEEKRTKQLADKMRNGTELRSFAVKDADMEAFCREARRIGLKYTLFRDQKAEDGITYFLVKSVDAARTARAIDRLGLEDPPEAEEKKEVQTEKTEDTVDLDYFVSRLTEKKKETPTENPTPGRTERSLSVPSSELKERETPAHYDIFSSPRVSVMGLLAKYKEEERRRDIMPQLERYFSLKEQREKSGKAI